MDDDFYGYQFLNGVNPNIITKCTALPENFPVTEAMVAPFLEGSSLQDQLEVCKLLCDLYRCTLKTRISLSLGNVSPFFLMQKGNIFIFDAKVLKGVPGRVYNGDLLQVTPGFCLLYVNAEKQLMPIAIQVFSQKLRLKHWACMEEYKTKNRKSHFHSPQLQQEPSETNPIFLPSDSKTDWLLAKFFIKMLMP